MCDYFWLFSSNGLGLEIMTLALRLLGLGLVYLALTVGNTDP